MNDADPSPASEGSPRERSRRGVAFVASGVAAVAGATLVGGEWPGTLVGTVASPLVFLLPDDLLAWGILTLMEYGRPLLAVTAAMVCVGAFTVIAAVVVRVAPAANRSRADTVFTVGLLQALLAFGVTLNPLIAGVAGVAGGITLGVAGAGVTDSRTVPRRRAVLQSVGLAAGTVGAAWLTAERVPPIPDAGTDDPTVRAMLDDADARSFDLPGAEPLVSEEFFSVDINTSTPVVDSEEWTLRIEGAGADSPFVVDYEDLTAREAEHRFVTLRCVSDDVNGRLIDTALWTGVPIDDLLTEADAPEDCCVYVEAEDGYYHSFPREALERGFLAWRMNGALLPRAHGHPVRALIPGHWGEINVKWISRIEIREEPAESYWEQHGWHGDGPVSTVAKIHSATVGDDGALEIGGHAYAGTRGVRAVGVSVDGGETWEDAELSDPLPGARTAAEESEAGGGGGDDDGAADVAADAWRMWRHEYDADGPHEVVVRAVERDGTVQPTEETDPYPEGASGWVSRDIDPTALD